MQQEKYITVFVRSYPLTKNESITMFLWVTSILQPECAVVTNYVAHKIISTVYKVAHYSLCIFFLSNCQSVWLLYNVFTPLCTPHPYSPSPVLPIPLLSMITAPPGASEFELGLPIIPPPPPPSLFPIAAPVPHMIVIIYKFVSVHVKYRMFH